MLIFWTRRYSFIIIVRYGEVIIVVGMNPNKKYQVTPMERAELVRKMARASIPRNNIRVEGMFVHEIKQKKVHFTV